MLGTFATRVFKMRLGIGQAIFSTVRLHPLIGLSFRFDCRAHMEKAMLLGMAVTGTISLLLAAAGPMTSPGKRTTPIAGMKHLLLFTVFIQLVFNLWFQCPRNCTFLMTVKN